MLKEEELRSKGWLDVNEILAEIEDKKKARISKDTWYQRTQRSREKIKELRIKLESGKYLYDPKIIDVLGFRPRVKIDYKKIVARELHSDKDFAELGILYGRIVDENQLLQEVRVKTGSAYTPGAIKQRRSRGSLVPVGYTISGTGKQKKWWYPVRVVDELNWQSRHAAHADEYAR